MKSAGLFAAAAVVVFASTVTTSAQDKPELVFVVNGASDFWKIAEAGVNKAQAELPNYDLYSLSIRNKPQLRSSSA